MTPNTNAPDTNANTSCANTLANTDTYTNDANTIRLPHVTPHVSNVVQPSSFQVLVDRFVSAPKVICSPLAPWLELFSLGGSPHRFLRKRCLLGGACAPHLLHTLFDRMTYAVRVS